MSTGYSSPFWSIPAACTQLQILNHLLPVAAAPAVRHAGRSELPGCHPCVGAHLQHPTPGGKLWHRPWLTGSGATWLLVLRVEVLSTGHGSFAHQQPLCRTNVAGRHHRSASRWWLVVMPRACAAHAPRLALRGIAAGLRGGGGCADFRQGGLRRAALRPGPAEVHERHGTGHFTGWLHPCRGKPFLVCICVSARAMRCR